MRGSVLVVGAGVAGIRAASELLQQGFHVHLLERSSEIGGMMRRVERLFPTGEHAACAWFPLTLDLVGNPNAEILTSAEIVSLDGVPGDFRVKALQHTNRGNPRELDLDVGAVIVATGVEEETSELSSRFGHDRLPNVVTALEFERQLLGTGPTLGMPRLANGDAPGSIVWLVLPGDSPVPYLTATVQARTVRERAGTSNASILHEKTHSHRSGDAAFIDEVEKMGVCYVEAASPEVDTTPSGNLVLSYANTEGARSRLETDMLVLCTPPSPGETAATLAVRIGVAVDDCGFIRREPSDSCRTSREGVFLCGAAAGSKGIGQSVIQACAAAAGAGALLAPARGSMPTRSRAKELPLIEKTDEPRIAVVLDEAGADGHLDLEAIAEYTRTLPGVGQVDVTPDAAEGSKVKEMLRTGEFNRLVVAGPSPITHESLLRRHVEEAGLNRFLLEMVNLHNQCVRVHLSAAEAASKAKTLMRMGVARARRLEPLVDIRVDVRQSCLVVGGSAAGLACATMLARMGIEVHLVEPSQEVGQSPGTDHTSASDMVATLREQRNFIIHAPAKVECIQGQVGRFDVELARNGDGESVNVGAIVLAAPPDGQVPSNGKGLAASLGLSTDPSGFYVPTEGILNSLDTTTSGVFICGPARDAMETKDAIVEGEAAASRAACILSSPVLTRPAVISSVVDRNCDGCAYCVEPCPTRSITLLEFMRGAAIQKVVEVSERTCIGCGICMATCPKEGIFVHHFKPDHFSAMVQAALEGQQRPLIVCFCCNRCAYPGADAAGVAGLEYPVGVLIIRVVCLGMIHPNIVTNALTQGADGVLLCGCHVGECRSREGIRKAEARAETIELLLEDFGLEPQRFRLESIAASEAAKFARIADEMMAELTALGPSPCGRDA